MKKIIAILLGMMAIGAMAGCQSETATPDANTTTDINKATEKPYVDHGTPYSDGPKTAPSVVGPTAPPGESIDQAQAVTTNENIRLTLPRKTEQSGTSG